MLIIVATLIMLVLAILAAIWVLVKGPSPTAQHLFVRSVNETSAVGFLANIYLSQTEVDAILGAQEEDEPYYVMDTSLVIIGSTDRELAEDAENTVLKPDDPTSANNAEDTPGIIGTDNAAAEQKDNTAPGAESGDTDDDTDGLELVEITGHGYRGFMLIVDDPTRIFLGKPATYGGNGITLTEMVKNAGAVAGINGGGFEDPEGRGEGGIPDGVVIADGEILWDTDGSNVSVIGFDADGRLHVGRMTAEAAVNRGIKWACSFGPVLVSNGEAADDNVLRSGLNPRTAIGQRADGAVLMLVIDGRQIGSLGATYGDLAEIFLEFGAVNAANLDGGTSTALILHDEVVNKRIGVMRRIPTGFLVK